MTQQPWAGYNPPQSPQQAMDYPARQQAPAALTPPPPLDASTMFDNVTDGLIAPSYQFQGVGDYVQGEVVRTKATYVTDMRSGAVKYSTPTPTHPVPRPYPQLNVVLQTEYRNWERVKRVPTQRNPDGTEGPELPADQDTGLRQIYVKYDMMRAVGVALREAGVGQGVGVQNGATLAVALTGQRPPRQPGDNPLPLYQAKYTKPAVSDTPAFDFGQQPTLAGQPNPVPQPQVNPEYQQAVAQQSQQGSPWQGPPTPAAPGSPWGGPQKNTDDPPF